MNFSRPSSRVSLGQASILVAEGNRRARCRPRALGTRALVRHKVNVVPPAKTTALSPAHV